MIVNNKQLAAPPSLIFLIKAQEASLSQIYNKNIRNNGRSFPFYTQVKGSPEKHRLVQCADITSWAWSTHLFSCTLSRWFPLYLVQVLEFASYCILAMSLQAQPGSSVGTRSWKGESFKEFERWKMMNGHLGQGRWL